MSGITGISKAMLQMSAGMKTEDVSKEMEESITASFMDLMNQNSLSGNIDVSADDTDMAIGGVAKEDAKIAYDATGSAKKEVTVKESTSIEETNEELSEQLDSYEEDIREVLKEELGVTDEEISFAMEALGLEFVDLTNRQNLASLIQTLTGEDVGTLFLSEAFQTIVDEVTELTEALCTELGVSKEELVALCESMKAVETKSDENVTFTTESDAESVEVVETEANEKVAANVETKDLEVDGQTVAVMEEVESDATEQTEVMQDEVAAKVVLQEKDDDATGKIMEADVNEPQIEKVELQTSSESDNAFAKNSSQTETNTTHAEMNTVAQPSQQAIEFLVQDQGVEPYTTQNLNATDIMEQVARNIRVAISAETTTMEMQLNPENLGRIHLNVSETEGVLRARILTQTEIVKEALELQLADLRQSLNQQGIKVEAIEVAVATHEFEQNLEGNAKQQEQMQQQMEETQKQTRRNLNLNELDGLQGLMSEEEALVAQMMKDNGNQVDLTA